MRNIFANHLAKKADKDKDIYIVVADISPAGRMVDFEKKNKDRFINVGVSEQFMIGLSAGLAKEKKKVFAYTIATFAFYRPFEMIRDDLCYQNLPVTVVGMGSGTVYSTLGGTHLTQEDISIARSLPNMRILAPSDPYELEKSIDFCLKNKEGPIYLRIGKSGEKNFTKKSLEKWKFGKIRKITNGKKICILTYGPIIKYAFEIRDYFLNKYKLDISIYSASTLKPFDIQRLKLI
jgi:transketolase